MENKGTGASEGQPQTAPVPLGSVSLYIKTTQTRARAQARPQSKPRTFFSGFSGFQRSPFDESRAVAVQREESGVSWFSERVDNDKGQQGRGEMKEQGYRCSAALLRCICSTAQLSG